MWVLEALSLRIPTVLSEEQVNRAPFTGILTRVDEPSTRPPNGSEGHCVLMPRAAAERALPSLLGMGVNSATNLREHAKKMKIGIITDASIDGNDLVVSGILYEKDFPDEVDAIRAEKDALGMSYELSNVDVDDPDADVWVLRSFVFTGAAILYKEAAAYQQTAIAAQAELAAVKEDGMPQQILDELKAIQLQLKTMQAASEEEAKAEEEAASTTEATADEKKEEEAAATTEAKADEEDAAAASTMKAMTALMKAMGYRDDEEEAAEDDAAMMKHMMKAMLRSMAYPGGGFGGEHDDEADDTALFKRLMRQGKMAAQSSGKKAATPQSAVILAMQKQLKELSAAMGLITDTLKRQTGLLTDMAKQSRTLATDENRGNNGGPVRRSMAATGAESWLGKFDQQAMDAASQDKVAQVAALDAELDKEGVTDPTVRMARKLDLEWSKAAATRN